jgi:hypothetical protein
MLVLAPAAIFVIALALTFELPQRIRNGLARLRARSLAPVRGG